MAVLDPPSFVGKEADINKALSEVAKHHGLKVVCTLQQSAMSYTTLLEEQHLAVKITDNGDPELIASPKVRTKAFLAALAGGLKRMCEHRGFRVYVAQREAADRPLPSAIHQEEPLTASELWAEYERSLDLPAEPRKSSIILRFVATDTPFKSKSQSFGTRSRTSDFI